MLAEGQSGRHALNVFYGAKVIEILRAAQAGDRGALGMSVSPEFTYTVTDGDYITTPRSAVGSGAAILLARIIMPKFYRIESIYDGPITIGMESCRWTVKVVFSNTENRVGHSVDFAFSEDRLISAKGDRLQVTSGEFPSLPN